MRGKKTKSPPQAPANARKAGRGEATVRQAGAGAANAKARKKATSPILPANRLGVESGASNVSEKVEEGNHGSYSVNSLSKLLGYDRRTIDKALVGIEPERIEGKTKFYKLSEVEKALREKKSSKLKDQKLIEEIRKLRIANDKEEGLTVEKGKVNDSVRRCLTPAAVTLEQRLVNEYPTAVAGLDVPQARIYGKRLYDELLGFLQSLEKEWTF
jgi:hypothetical protein